MRRFFEAAAGMEEEETDLGDVVNSADIPELLYDDDDFSVAEPNASLSAQGTKRKRGSDTTEASDTDHTDHTDHGDFNDIHGNDEGEFADAAPPRLPGDNVASETESDTDDEAESDDEASALVSSRCPVCDLATSEVVEAMNACSDRLAGQVSEQCLCAIQLEIWQKRTAPLRQQGRDVPLLTLQILKRHYSKHRINVMRSVSEDIRVLETMQRALRRTGLCDYDQDNNKVLSHRGSSEMGRISKQKTDLLKFYSSLQRDRKKEMQNS